MCMGEPILYNPNSYATVEAILNDYKELHDIGNSRHWVFLGCDGVPYRLASKIKLANPEKFDWLVLLPGLGHIHMNQLKSFFKVADQIILEALGKEVLNFSSPRAYKYFLSANDTHKSFQYWKFCCMAQQWNFVETF